MRHELDCIVAFVKRAALVALAFLIALAPARAARAQEAIYIVRHAERLNQSANSPLSSDGVGRAQRLREMLRAAGVTHIFTSELRRTIETAQPLADALRLMPQPLAGADVRGLASRLAALKPHDRALVVGHSNTVPDILRALKVATPVTIAEAEYDNLFIVVPQKDAAPVLLRLKF
jgi:broad specificity phosphatase PhoE